MAAKTKDETVSYGGQSLTLHAMHGQFCPPCSEGVWDEESYRRYTEAQAALLQAVKGDMSAQIRGIRKNLKLTQTELAQAFGVGKRFLLVGIIPGSRRSRKKPRAGPPDYWRSMGGNARNPDLEV
ncbi:MAG: type II toxin-antitoxin system MqsA family antitoxin, partial [Desulfobacterota bacterium]|nr:type II toxin-antitoxin system MqsA family antitoxin [Thermodesulfobacteriota bacterium]